VNKTGFPGVVIGLSGGIDSAVAAALAVEALGSNRVRGILMPGPYSSAHSVSDALALADNLNIKTITVPIIDMYDAWKGVSEGFVNHDKETITHENIQARSRGVILMSYSNETGFMVLTTGNKSEMSVGYATLYGDMNGGFNALKDVYKTTVFALAENYNETSRSEVIPANTINKPPSAELAPDQEDSNTLPPYEILDGILRGLVEDEDRICDISKKLCVDKTLVQKIQNMLYSAEFKRRQACPGTKITNRAFGKDRRFPIVNKYRD
jgi:NAD+ synthase